MAHSPEYDPVNSEKMEALEQAECKAKGAFSDFMEAAGEALGMLDDGSSSAWPAASSPLPTPQEEPKEKVAMDTAYGLRIPRTPPQRKEKKIPATTSERLEIAYYISVKEDQAAVEDHVTAVRRKAVERVQPVEELPQQRITKSS